MRRIVINLPDSLYAELAEMSAQTRDVTCSPARFAQEIVEADLASRRLRHSIKAEALERKPVPMESVYEL
jgi:metal-responsive CopG/Arc/MetJ family transcriptional regulator